MKAAAVIPARYGSSRFPGKPLVQICNRPMIEWVYRRTAEADCLQNTIVATDDRRIYKAVKDFQGLAVMTDHKHESGTDRVAEAAEQLDCDLIVNVQGDEPLIRADMIETAVDLLEDEDKETGAEMATLAAPMDRKLACSQDRVKVVLDKNGYALYFSRSLIPGGEEENEIEEEIDDMDVSYHNPGREYLQHIGLYVFRREFLFQYASMDPTPLEQRESLEQLRVLENGYDIKTALVKHHGPGVDRPEDVKKVDKILREEIEGGL